MVSSVPILLYHSVVRDATPCYRPWAVQPEMFAAHMAYLRDQGYTAITVSQLVQARTETNSGLPSRPVVVTFDDGLGDFYTGALPVLQRQRFPATLYLVSGCIEGTSCWLQRDGESEHPMLTWDQLAEIAASGVECGAHTHTHPRLGFLSPAAARDEIARSKAVLEDRLGQHVTTFSYPHGKYTAAVRRMVQQAGYSSACAVNHALSTVKDDRFALSRIVVTGNTNVEDLASLLAGRGLPALPRLRSVVRRVIKGGLCA